MRINYKGKYSQIITAIEDANDILNSEDFYTLISDHEDFNCSEFSSEQISQILKNSELEIEVKIYKPRWRFSKVLGYFVKNKPNNVFLNSRKIYRNTPSITNTIVHEYVHAVDYNNNTKESEFGHNCGVLQNTAPYIIGQIAEMLIEGSNISDISKQIQKFDHQDDICINTDEKDNLSTSGEIFTIQEHRIL